MSLAFQLALRWCARQPRGFFDPEQPDGMPAGFSLTDEGIFQLRSKDDEDIEPVLICSPICVKGICCAANGKQWARVVSVQDLNGGRHELILDEKNVSKRSMTVLDALLDHGLQLASAEKAAQSVLELLAAWRPNKHYLRANRLGWTDKSFGAFILGNSRVIGEKLVVVDGAPHHNVHGIGSGRGDQLGAQPLRHQLDHLDRINFVARKPAVRPVQAVRLRPAMNTHKEPRYN